MLNACGMQHNVTQFGITIQVIISFHKLDNQYSNNTIIRLKNP